MILDDNPQAEQKQAEQKADVIFTDEEIFTKIWTSPRLVFKYLNNHGH